jgi:hypothetical protein
LAETLVRLRVFADGVFLDRVREDWGAGVSLGHFVQHRVER